VDDRKVNLYYMTICWRKTVITCWYAG